MINTLRQTVTRMAIREANAHLLAASTSLSVRIQLSVRRCPWCGADERDARLRPSALPIRGWKPGYDWAPESHGNPILEILGCEALTARSLLPLGAAVHRHPELRHATFRSRAFTWLGLSNKTDRDALGELDEAERWVESPHCPESPVLSLPAASRCVPPGELPGSPHFLTAHIPSLRQLNDLYLSTRLSTVRAQGGFAQCSSA